MLLSVHATVGAIIGENVNTPLLAFVLAFISHFILDIIPHGDAKLIKAYRNDFKNKGFLYLIIFDLIATIIILALLLISHKISYSQKVFWGIMGGILPDLMVASHEITNKYFKRWHKIHTWTHDRINWAIPLQLGIIVQIIIIYLILR
jgi:zinc transporter ZupT